MYIGSTGHRAASTTSSTRSSTTPSTRRWPGYNDSVEVTIHPDNSVTVRDRGRGIPVDVIPEHGPLGARGRPDEAARRRQVRRRRLQGLRRPARRRRLGRERALGVADRRRSSATARSTARSSRAACRRATMEVIGDDDGDRHDDLVPARRRDLRRDRVPRRRRCVAAPARDGVPDARPAHHLHRRARRAASRSSSTTRAASRTSSPTSTSRRTSSTSTSSTSRARPTQGEVEVAMQWNNSYQESVFSFANNINTHEGGSHLSGFKAALTRTLNDYARAKGLLKEKEDNLDGEDVREGLAAVISRQADRTRSSRARRRRSSATRGCAASSSRRSTRSSRSSSRRTRPTRAQMINKAISRRARAPGGAQGARADAAQVGARDACRCRASSPTARSTTPRPRSSSSSRATPPAARRRWAATAPTRRSCRCAGRSSTARRTASTRCSRTTRSRR